MARNTQPKPNKETTEKDIFNEENKDMTPKEEMVTISKDAFQEVLNRLAELENGTIKVDTEEDDIYDPLAQSKQKKRVRISYFYDPETNKNFLIKSYIPRVSISGKEMPTWYIKDEKLNEMRLRCSLVVLDENFNEFKKENIDYLNVLEAIETKEYEVEEIKNIGKQVKQEFVIQKIWNGKTLAPTNTRVQTGYQEQKNEYIVNVDGKLLKFDQSVINIK